MAADTTKRLLPKILNGSSNSVTGLIAMMLLANSTVTASAAMMTSLPENCMLTFPLPLAKQAPGR